MTPVYLSEAARKTVHQIVNARHPETTAFVILQDVKTDTLMARIVSKDLLALLKTKAIGELIPGVEVHTFGMEKLSPEVLFEFHFLPLHQTVLMNDVLLERNLNYLLEVRVRSGKPVQEMHLSANAS
jgi:hypothetical protein